MNVVVRRLLGCGTIAVLGVVLAMIILPGTGGVHRGRRTQCMSFMRNVSFALHTYATDNQGRLPPAYIADEHGQPMHSWRVLLLPYLDQQSLYDQYRFDEPWNGPNNSKLAKVIPEVYQCPNEYGHAEGSHPWTSYVAVVGPHTLWPGAEPGQIDDIPDGQHRTLLLVEVHDSGIHWMEPRDLKLDEMNPQINSAGTLGISSVHPGVAHVIFADGHGGPLSEKVRPEVLRQLIQRDDGGPAEADLP
ncbi:MAG: DUF1559 domain-containing protein [Planctomycetaceae bacterium]